MAALQAVTGKQKVMQQRLSHDDPFGLSLTVGRDTQPRRAASRLKRAPLTPNLTLLGELAENQ